MVETLLAAFIVSKVKHYKIKYIFFHWSFYPVILMQCILIFLQVGMFFQYYQFIPYVSVIKIAVIVSSVFPIICFQLYKPAFWGCGAIVLGTCMNQFVIAQNNGKMPVFPTLSYLTGYVKPDLVTQLDNLHILGSASTRFNFLSDYIDLGYSILSPGDVFIHLFLFLILYFSIQSVNLIHTPFIAEIEKINKG